MLGIVPGAVHSHSGLLRWPSFVHPSINESEADNAAGTDSLDSTLHGQLPADTPDSAREEVVGGLSSAAVPEGGGGGGKWVTECFTGAAGQIRGDHEQELTPLRSDVERGEGGGEEVGRAGHSGGVGGSGEMRSTAGGGRKRASPNPPLAPAATAAAGGGVGTAAAAHSHAVEAAGARAARANERNMSEVALQLSVFGFEVRCAARREVNARLVDLRNGV